MIRKIFEAMMLLLISANLFGQEKIRYFEGESRYFDSSFLYSLESVFLLKPNNLVEAVIVYKIKKFTPTQKAINEARNNSEGGFLKNRPDSVIAKVLINHYKKQAPEKYYCAGKLDAAKNRITLQQVTSFENGGVFVPDSYYNFSYINGKLIDLDTACSNCYSAISMAEVKTENTGLKNELKNKIEADLTIAREKEINNERQKQIEAKRVAYIKKATVGDLMIYTQDWERTDSYLLGFYKKNTAYKMIIKCYIERIEGEKYQVRVADVSSNNSENYSTPDINGIKIHRGDIIWVKPFKDKNWFWGEDE